MSQVTDHSAELMKYLMLKLYKTVTGSDQNIQLARNKFITWLMPGIPFAPNDFNFCHKGLVGDEKNSTQDLYHQAFVLSKLFDFIPDIPNLGSEGNQFQDTENFLQTTYTTSQDTLSSVWNDVLKYSRVINNEISEKEKKKLKKFRNLLSVTKEITDIVTDEKKKVTEPGPLTIAYTAKMNEYIEAADEYMNMLIDAQAGGNDPESRRKVSAWANKSKFMRLKVEAAWGAWNSQGYKNEYEHINAYIEQVTQKSMVLYKQDLQEKFKNALLSSPAEGTAGDFYYTTLIPGNFATSPGWTKFSFGEGDIATSYSKETKEWGGKGGISIGSFSLGGKASGSKTKELTKNKTTNFKASLEFVQIPILRAWFDPGFFSMRAWTLDKLWDLNFEGKKVSDGEIQPQGRLVAYPVIALFVRNVSFTFDDAEEEIKALKEKIGGGGSLGWGPLKIGGRYEKGKETKDVHSHTENGEVKIDGLQLIGFINNLIPKAPNPNPDISPEQFVGGEQTSSE
ncbi:MAG: hypothetical protein OES15_01135 [Nitrosopumilus sp.]|nr:hypothetical protein [Nitrosopumilus sp.]MDH3852860.1 hypothetical protein [Nitrosopumilus sp.]